MIRYNVIDNIYIPVLVYCWALYLRMLLEKLVIFVLGKFVLNDFLSYIYTYINVDQ